MEFFMAKKKKAIKIDQYAAGHQAGYFAAAEAAADGNKPHVVVLLPWHTDEWMSGWREGVNDFHSHLTTPVGKLKKARIENGG